MNHVLFICTGNFYRSRFAEAVFNHGAEAQHLPWRAFSRGLDIGAAPDAPISEHTIQGLAERGICVHHTAIDRTQVSVNDFTRADLIIALKESEHRPMILRAFPEWDQKVRYWDVSDVGDIPPERALPAIEKLVRSLLAELKAAGQPA